MIERADLLGRLTEFALTDTLTGLPNRRAWDKRLEQAIGDGEPICVAILDLDRFKSYNDDHGHQAGDRLLKEATTAWRAECARDSASPVTAARSTSYSCTGTTFRPRAASWTGCGPRRLAGSRARRVSRAGKPAKRQRRCSVAPTRRSMPRSEPAGTAH